MIHKKGYVYILTNPSFREDWVKIGKSSREVDIRSKELDNTAVPLPFEIYATVKTSKFNEIESSFHKILTDLADRRIRKNREFFNIKPEEALEYLQKLAQLTDDAEVNSPMEEMKDSNTIAEENRKGKYIVTNPGPYYMKNGIIDATMEIQNDKYVVLEGSKIDPNYYSHEDLIKRKRIEYKDCVDELGETIIKNIPFNSPSMAAEFVRGGASNGKYYWRTRNNKALNDFIKYKTD